MKSPLLPNEKLTRWLIASYALMLTYRLYLSQKEKGKENICSIIFLQSRTSTQPQTQTQPVHL